MSETNGVPTMTCEDSEESMQASEALTKARIDRTTAEFLTRADRPRAYWQKPIKKVLVTLNIGDYAPAIRALTYPLMQHYARKIGAEFREITERKYPNWPTVYEKLQCRDICREENADWVLFFDADALINPEMFDVTAFLDKSTVMFNGKDMSAIRSRPDSFFKRDGRYLGACNWFCVASDWCADDLWRPLDDITFEEAKANIFVSVQEHNGGQFQDYHLIDDYTLSRNVARFGLKHKQLAELCGELGWRDSLNRGANIWMWHQYSIPENVKIENMLRLLSTPQQNTVDVGGGRPFPGWQLMSASDCVGFKKEFKLK